MDNDPSGPPYGTVFVAVHTLIVHCVHYHIRRYEVLTVSTVDTSWGNLITDSSSIVVNLMRRVDCMRRCRMCGDNTVSYYMAHSDPHPGVLRRPPHIVSRSHTGRGYCTVGDFLGGFNFAFFLLCYSP